MQQDRTRHHILFSCTGQAKKDYEPFVEDHVVAYILNGTMIVNDGQEVTEYRQGDIGFALKNQLVKTQKIPEGNRPFMGISVILPKEDLYNYAKEHRIVPKGRYTGKSNFVLPYDPFLKGYFDSMLPYFENPGELTESLAKIKTMEIVELLMRETRMQNILFNFEEDFKVNLEAYMNRNYMHSIPIEQFARLTGRSLSTFKRDFQKTFGSTPNKWLMKKRLDLAHYLISAKNRNPSDAYFDVGFVNFSHFSRCFKSEFGMNPSELSRKSI